MNAVLFLASAQQPEAVPQPAAQKKKQAVRKKVVKKAAQVPAAPAKPTFEIQVPEGGVSVGAPQVLAAPEPTAPEVKIPETKLAEVRVPEVTAPTVPQAPKPEVKMPESKKPGGKLPDLASFKKKIIEIPTGSPVTVKMPDKSLVTGKLGAVTNEGFQLQTLNAGQIADRKIGFNEISGVQAGAPQPAWKTLSKRAFYVVSLVGTAGAITAAIKKK